MPTEELMETIRSGSFCEPDPTGGQINRYRRPDQPIPPHGFQQKTN
jgi:hypothetical protein